MPTPSALIAAVLTGWAAAWAGVTIGFNGLPAVILGIIVWATVTGNYRRRSAQ